MLSLQDMNRELSITELKHYTSMKNEINEIIREKQEEYMRKTLIPFLKKTHQDNIIHLSENFLQFKPKLVRYILDDAFIYYYKSTKYRYYTNCFIECYEKNKEEVRYLLLVKLILLVKESLSSGNDAKFLVITEDLDETFCLMNKISNGYNHIGMPIISKSGYINYDWPDCDIWIDLDNHNENIPDLDNQLQTVFIDNINRDIQSSANIIRFATRKNENRKLRYFCYFDNECLLEYIKDAFIYDVNSKQCFDENISDIIYDFIY
jgi:hypothetical protein